MPFIDKEELWCNMSKNIESCSDSGINEYDYARYVNDVLPCVINQFLTRKSDKEFCWFFEDLLNDAEECWCRAVITGDE